MTSSIDWQSGSTFYRSEVFSHRSQFGATTDVQNGVEGFLIQIENQNPLFVPRESAEAIARFILTGEGAINTNPDA